MLGAALRGALVGAVVVLGGTASAGEPVLPPPRPLVTEMTRPISYVRPDPYAVWQFYDVDRSGRFRPVVAPSYGGLRYVATGEPFPWWQNYPQSVKPVMGNPATFEGPRETLLIMPAPAPAWDRMPYAEK